MIATVAPTLSRSLSQIGVYGLALRTPNESRAANNGPKQTKQQCIQRALQNKFGSFESGLQIPKDIAVVGCGNAHYDDLLIVPLTSVDQDSTNLGNNAAKLAINNIKRKSSVVKTILMPATVVVKASSKR